MSAAASAIPLLEVTLVYLGIIMAYRNDFLQKAYTQYASVFRMVYFIQDTEFVPFVK
jgi:hypothetical protein